MKKNNLVQIFLLMLFSIDGFAKNECRELNLISSAEDLLKIVTYNGCSESENKCIQDAIAKGAKTDGSFGEKKLRNQIDEAYVKIQNKIEKNKAKYFEKYASLYKILTANAAAQRMVLDIDTNPKGVGCTAKDMSNGIQLRIKNSLDKQILALEDLKKDAIKKSNSRNASLQSNGDPHEI